MCKAIKTVFNLSYIHFSNKNMKTSVDPLFGRVFCTVALLLLPVIFYAQASVKIGALSWTTENLNVEKFRNGDPILQVRSFDEMKKAHEQKKPAWCYLDFDPLMGLKYGRLYNWYAIIDPRGLAPAGWRIPTTLEWYALCIQLGGEEVAGQKMKTSYGWAEFVSEFENINKNFAAAKGTNESGMSVLPSGSMPVWWKKKPADEQTDAWFWSSTEVDNDLAFVVELRHVFKKVLRQKREKESMFSVRCVKQ
jgi:uncharacterized protein (TIGR02145 family)